MVKPLIRPAPQRGYARTRGTPNSKKKEALIQDKIYLKYIRLKCKDIEKTVEFYQTLGMVVEYRVEETYKEDVAPGLINECVKTVVAITGENLNPQTMTLTGKQAFQALFDTTGNRSQLLFEHIKVTPKEVTVEADTTSTPSSNSNPSSPQQQSSSTPKKTQQIKDALKQKTPVDSNPASKIQTPSTPSGAVAAAALERNKKRNNEYLVIYVHFLQRLAKRLMSKTNLCEIMMHPIDVSETKLAIVNDPNGLEIRLMELTDAQLNEVSSKKNWFSRLGYYTIPVTSSEEAVRYYEKVFAFQVSKKDADQQRLMTPTKGSNLAQKMADDRRNITAANAIAKMGAGVAAKNGGAKPTQPKVMLGQVTGFRLVDTEEFVIGLQKSVYSWMGNDLRAGSFAICFVEKGDVGVSLRATSNINERLDLNSPLVSMGFMMNSIDSYINRLKYDSKTATTVQFDDSKYMVKGVGNYRRMFSNRVQTMLELFNDDKASLTAEMASKQLSSNDELSNKKSDNDKKKHEQEQRKVNLNHLKGYAKNYSLGALTDIKSDLLGEDWEEEHGNVSDGGSSVNSSDSEGTARRKTMRKNYKLENKDADKKPKQKSKSSIF